MGIYLYIYLSIVITYIFYPHSSFFLYSLDSSPFEYLDRVTIENLVQTYTKEFETTQKYYRNRIKADMLGNPVLKFRVI